MLHELRGAVGAPWRGPCRERTVGESKSPALTLPPWSNQAGVFFVSARESAGIPISRRLSLCDSALHRLDHACHAAGGVVDADVLVFTGRRHREREAAGRF